MLPFNILDRSIVHFDNKWISWSWFFPELTTTYIWLINDIKMGKGHTLKPDENPHSYEMRPTHRRHF